MVDDWKDDELFERLAEEGPGWVDSGEDFERLGRIREARIKLGLRTAVVLVSVLLSVYFLRIAHPNLLYWLDRSVPATDLGDLRRDDDARQRIEALESHTRVVFTNDVPTIDSLKTDQEDYFYFSPLTHCIVKTPEPVPEKGTYLLTTPELGPFESQLVINKRAHPEDVMVSMKGDGRLLLGGDLPPRYGALLGFFSQQSKVPPDQICLILDGDLPDDNWPAAPMTALPLVIVLITLGIFGAALRGYIRVRRNG
ncbi:MAG: hypothetical protein ABIK09_16135 [Pseudomonadota bacterium]